MENLKAFHSDVDDETVIKPGRSRDWPHDFIMRQPMVPDSLGRTLAPSFLMLKEQAVIVHPGNGQES
jgi:hypothetical protein